MGKLGPLAQFKNPQSLPGENKPGEKKDEEKITIKSGHYILSAMPNSNIHTSLGPEILAPLTQE